LILTAHQPSYLPWLGLFHKIALADKFIFFNDVQYSKWDWSTRNKIKTPEGDAWLTIPVLSGGKHGQKFTEVKIDNTQKWKKKHLKTILLNYKRTPFYDKYYSFFEQLYEKEWEYLSDVNEYMLKWFLKELGINIEFLKATDFDFQSSKSDLILDMCKKLKADIFVFGKLGKGYANIDDFNNENIKTIFQEYIHPTYPQIHGNFISNLSILDLLFNCGPKSYEIIMSNNISKNELT